MEVYLTLDEVLAALDEVTFNQIARATKVLWLSTLDGQIYTELHSLHEGYPDEPPAPLDAATDGARELLVPLPYAEGLYVPYLQMRVYEAEGELLRYSNASVLYNSMLLTYMDYVNRTHMPKGVEALTLC